MSLRLILGEKEMRKYFKLLQQYSYLGQTQLAVHVGGGPVMPGIHHLVFS
jgi:hypothetical protein